MDAATGQARPLLRDPCAAGLYYPRDEQALRCVIDDCLATVSTPGELAAKALIVPHAGYRYSGPVAAHAYAALGASRHRIRRVVVVAPPHGATFQGVAVPASDAYLTPLGAVPVDGAARSRLARHPEVSVQEHLHAMECTIEIQLPFLQRQLRDFTLVPMLVGEVREEILIPLLERVWTGDDTLLVVSSDLSRYNSFEEAQRLDGEASRAIERLQPHALEARHACGHVAIRALLHLAGRRSLRARTLSLRNSGEIIGAPSSEVVGYGAFAFQ
jgi:AmmeMemoRadiSam system protein B